jgi:uncharacterized protein YtpQ (UPF0354 family)
VFGRRPSVEFLFDGGGAGVFRFWRKRRQAELDRSMIVPRIKHTNFLGALRDRGVPHDQMPVTEPLVADLLVTYAFDLPEMFKMASGVDLQRLSIAHAELRPLALANLRRQMPRIGIADEPPLRRIVTGNDLEACSLLANSFWDGLAGDMPGGSRSQSGIESCR